MLLDSLKETSRQSAILISKVVFPSSNPHLHRSHCNGPTETRSFAGAGRKQEEEEEARMWPMSQCAFRLSQLQTRWSWHFAFGYPKWHHTGNISSEIKSYMWYVISCNPHVDNKSGLIPILSVLVQFLITWIRGLISPCAYAIAR